MRRAEERVIERRAKEGCADKDWIILKRAMEVTEERVEELERVGKHVPAVRAGSKGSIEEGAVGERIVPKGIAGVGLRVSGLLCGWRPYAMPIVKLQQVSSARVVSGARSWIRTLRLSSLFRTS